MRCPSVELNTPWPRANVHDVAGPQQFASGGLADSNNPGALCRSVTRVPPTRELAPTKKHGDVLAVVRKNRLRHTTRNANLSGVYVLGRHRLAPMIGIPGRSRGSLRGV